LVFHSSTITMMHGPINIRSCMRFKVDTWSMFLNLQEAKTRKPCCRRLFLLLWCKFTFCILASTSFIHPSHIWIKRFEVVTAGEHCCCFLVTSNFRSSRQSLSIGI